jgi:hypothetical protein
MVVESAAAAALTCTSSRILNMLTSMLATLGVGANTLLVVTRMSISSGLMPVIT